MSARQDNSAELMQGMLLSARNAGLLMGAAVKIIDHKFGDNYAANNPQLVGLFLLSALVDFHALELSSILASMADAQQGIAEALDFMAARSDSPAAAE